MIKALLGWKWMLKPSLWSHICCSCYCCCCGCSRYGCQLSEAKVRHKNWCQKSVNYRRWHASVLPENPYAWEPLVHLLMFISFYGIVCVCCIWDDSPAVIAQINNSNGFQDLTFKNEKIDCWHRRHWPYEQHEPHWFDISIQNQDLAPTLDVRQFFELAVNFLIHDCMSK